MFLARVTFAKAAHIEAEALEGVVEAYLGALLQNGQIGPNMVTGWQENKRVAFVKLPRRDSFVPVYHSRYGLKALAELESQFNTAPSWTLLQDDEVELFVAPETAPAFVLHTTMLSDESPLHRADNGQGVPTYLLPLTEEDRSAIYFWESEFKALDSIWFASGALEAIAYQQLNNPESEISRQGRGLCQRIETAMGIPVYYMLLYYDYGQSSETPVCPSCGNHWRTDTGPDTAWLSQTFARRCDRCRLVVNDPVFR